MLITWFFYGMHYISCLAGSLLTCLDFQNRYGASNGSKALLIIVGILNAARNSFSFFLLLIVCMGYGVVKPTLGRTMIYVRWLAAAHFVFGLVYSITSLLISPENAGKKKKSTNLQYCNLTHIQAPLYSSLSSLLPER